jgi:serine/threonine-protein phosphatase 2A regulatory subunit B''
MASPRDIKSIEMPEVDDDSQLESLPRFYLKDEHGKHRRRSLTYEAAEHVDEDPKDIWPNDPEAPISKEDFMGVTKDVCGFPSFFNSSFYDRVSSASPGGVVSRNSWSLYYTKYIQKEDRNARFFHAVAKPGEQHITRDDFVPLVSALLAFHAGLEFLSEHKEVRGRWG